MKKSEEEVLRESRDVEETVTKKTATGTREGTKLSKISRGRVYIQATYNNTKITFTDSMGAVIAWASAGSIGFKGTKKSTPFAASRVAETVAEKMRKFRPEEISIFVRGIGSGRDSAIRAIGNQGFNIVHIKDVTPLPHNGCRPPKVRRV